MKSKVKLSLTIILFIVFVFFVFKKSYNLFPQVEYLYLKKVEIIDLIKQKNLHLLRYLVVYIPIFLSNLLKVDVKKLYTLYLGIIGSGLIYLSCKIFLLRYKCMKNLLYIYILIFYIFIYCLVNGRILFAYLAEIILIFEVYSHKSRKTIILLSIFLASVSSGTMLVIVFTILFNFLKPIKIKEIIKKRTLLIIPIIFIVAYYSQKMIEKNLVFFEGNILKVLTHGIFSTDNLDLTITISLIYLLLILIGGVLLEVKKDIVRSLIFISMLCGLFGKTTFLMCLVPIFIEFGCFINRIKIIKRGTNVKNND